jgi:hypothetical protein
LAWVSFLDVASSDSLTCLCFPGRCADVAGDAERLYEVAAGFAECQGQGQEFAEVDRCPGLTMPVAQVAEQLHCPGQAGGSGRAVPGQPLYHAEALKGPGLTSPQIGERQYISRRTAQTHLVYVFATLDIAFRASSPPRSPATASRSRPGTGRTGWGQRPAR